LKELSVLELNSNNIEILDGDVFLGISNLLNLYLEDNALKILSAGIIQFYDET
jgi:hypothetical protein